MFESADGMQYIYKEEYIVLKKINDIFHADTDKNGLQRRRFSKLFGLCEDSLPSPFIVTDFIPNSFVASMMEHIHGLALAVEQIHRFGFVHMDIKPENVRVKENVVKLIDFGFSEYLSDNPAETRVVTNLGTPVHMAPEVLRSAKFLTGDDKKKVDIWGIGIVAFTTLTRSKFLHSEACITELNLCVDNTFDRQTQYDEWLASYLKALYRLTREVLKERVSSPMPEHEKFVHPADWQHSDVVGERCAKRCRDEPRPRLELHREVCKRVTDDVGYTHEADTIVDQMTRLVFDRLLRFFAADRASIADVVTDIGSVMQFIHKLEQGGNVGSVTMWAHNLCHVV